MGQKIGATVMITAIASVMIGCSQQPAGPVVVADEQSLSFSVSVAPQ